MIDMDFYELFELIKSRSGLYNKDISEVIGKNANTFTKALNRRSLSELEKKTIAEYLNFNYKSTLKLVKAKEPDENYNAKEESTDQKTTSSNLPQTVTVDSQGNENIVMVPVAAQAGYLTGYDDPEYLKQLPAYRLPKINNGTYRMFEVKGHSMLPTIHAGAIVVGEWVENWEEDIKDNLIYVIVSKEDGIVIKRVINRLEKYGNLCLKSDNRKEFPSYPIEKKDIVQVWKLKTGLLFEFSDPADLYDRMSDMEAELMNMKKKLLS